MLPYLQSVSYLNMTSKRFKNPWEPSIGSTCNSGLPSARFKSLTLSVAPGTLKHVRNLD